MTSEMEKSRARDMITRARVSCMAHAVFSAFSGPFSVGEVEITDEIPTACTDGWNEKYNPQFILSLDIEEVRFVCLHEGGHKAFRHLTVWKDLWKENADLTNYCADMVLNIWLMKMDDGAGFIRMPKEGVKPDSQFDNMSVKQVFDAHKADSDKQQAASSAARMDGHDWDAASEWEEGASDEEKEGRAKEMDRALRAGEALQRAIGRGKGDAAGVFGELLRPKLDPYAILRQFLTDLSRTKEESTWRRPNKRYLADSDLYMPSMDGTAMDTLVIGMDTSGSCFGTRTMTRFVTEIGNMVSAINPQKCYVVYWDYEVQGMQVFEDGQFAVQNIKPRGGGGTRGSVLFDYLRAEKISPNAIVQFTDGEVGSFGKSDWPTIWAITTHIKAPFGTTIHLEE